MGFDRVSAFVSEGLSRMEAYTRMLIGNTPQTGTAGIRRRRLPVTEWLNGRRWSRRSDA